jgi:hypothetical protein
MLIVEAALHHMCEYHLFEESSVVVVAAAADNQQECARARDLYCTSRALPTTVWRHLSCSAADMLQASQLHRLHSMCWS